MLAPDDRQFRAAQMHALAVDVDQDAHGDHGREQAGAAVAHERQRKAFVRQKRGGDAHVEQGLHAEQKRQTGPEELPEAIWRIRGHHEAAHHQQGKSQHRARSAAQAKFLANHGKNEVRVRLRQIRELHAPFAESAAFHATAAKSQFGHPLLQSAAFFVRLEVKEHHHAIKTVRQPLDARSETAAHAQDDQEKITQLRSSHEHQTTADHRGQQRVAEVKLAADQRHDAHQDQSGKQESFFEGALQSIVRRKPGREGDDQDDLCKLARLDARGGDADALQADPATRAIDHHADARHVTQRQQQSGANQQVPAPADEEIEVQQRRHDAGSQARTTPHHLTPQPLVILTIVRHLKRRARQHRETQRKETDDRSEQKNDGVTGQGQNGLSV